MSKDLRPRHPTTRFITLSFNYQFIDHSFASLALQLWVDSDQKFVSITTPKRLIANESVIRVSAKTGNSFNCFAELLVDNEKKFESEVVIEKYFKEKQKYLKVLSFLSDKCVKALGKRLKDFSQRKIEVLTRLKEFERIISLIV